MLKLSSALALAGAFWVSHLALAAPKATAKPVAKSEPTQGLAALMDRSNTAARSLTIDQLEQQLLNDKSRRVHALYKVQNALNNQEWKKAVDAAKSLEAKPEYADYYHFLMGQAERGRMRKFMQGGQNATALVAGEQARYHLTQVQVASPYTTLWRKANSLLGEVEITIADLHLRAHRRKKALTNYENGFQRLSQANLLPLVPKFAIINYALMCDKAANDLCASWLMKLAPLVSKSDEVRIIERIAAFKRPYIERTPQIPYKIDLDLQAFQVAYQQYLAGKYDDAFAAWRTLLAEYPRTTIRLRTKFWMGRAAQRSNHEVEAETLYREIIKELPFSYYALLASWFGKIDLSRMMDAALPMASSETPLLTPSDIVHIRRAEMLIASAVPELAVLELADVRPNLNMSNDFLVYLVALNHLAGNHSAAFQMLGELSTRSFQGLFSSYGQKLYFPTARMPLIRSVAAELKVDPLLMISIVKQESAFNSDATSSAAAYGLMQIIAGTARDMDPKVEILDLFQPLTNLKLGGKYLQKLLARYKGNVVAALAAYNAGPGHSDRWLRDAAPGLPPEEFVELIGFRETREYVQNIVRNYYWYHRRINHEPLLSLAALTQIFTQPVAPAVVAVPASAPTVAKTPSSAAVSAPTKAVATSPAAAPAAVTAPAAVETPAAAPSPATPTPPTAVTSPASATDSMLPTAAGDPALTIEPASATAPASATPSAAAENGNSAVPASSN